MGHNTVSDELQVSCSIMSQWMQQLLMSPQQLQQLMQQWLKSPQQEVQQWMHQNISSTNAMQLELKTRQEAQAFCIPPRRWLTMQPQDVFCFYLSIRTTQQLWQRLTQVSCSLSIRTTQQLWQRLTQVSCCLLIRTTQKLQWQLSPTSHFSWLLKVSLWFATKTTQKLWLQVSCSFA